MPASCPAMSAPPRIGVKASRLRKPDWISRARSVPAFIVAKSAPWMNGKARKKARNESVGKRGIFVAGFSPADVTASSAIGKTNGKITFAGWRIVRRTERRAICPTCAASVMPAPALPLLRPPRASGPSLRGRHRLGVEGADDPGEVARAVGQSYRDTLGRTSRGLAELLENARDGGRIGSVS